jgi:phosphoribosyl 1,2-cyclic phosphodiesterase
VKWNINLGHSNTRGPVVLAIIATLIIRYNVPSPVTRARLVVLGSSSSGNSTLVEAGDASVLVDAGFSARELTRRMALVGSDPADIDAIVVTHEHVDHVSGVRVLARRHGIPVHGSPGTLKAAARYLDGVDVRPRPVGEPFGREGFKAILVPVPHDAKEPTAVRLEMAGLRFLVATDLGHFPWDLLETGQDMDALVLESNHDERMLEEGPYPVHLKRRIRGPNGHLSNRESAVALRALLGPRTRGVLLGHLSQSNNREDVALETVLSGVPGSMRDGVDIRTTAPDRVESLEL